MAQFRQKLFVIPLVAAALPHLGTAANVAMVGSSVYGVKQGLDAQKQSEEAAEQQADLIRKQNKILEKAAQANPQAALQGASEMRSFGWVAAGKEILSRISPEIKKSVGMGVAFAGAGYGVDKFIQHDMKKSNQQIPAPQDQPSQENYSAIGIGGHLKDIGKSVLEGLSPVVKNPATGGLKFNGGFLMTAGLSSMPLIGYYQQKKANQQMAAQTQQPQQTQYSWLSGVGNYFKSWKATPGLAWQNTKNGVTKGVTGMMSFGFGGVDKTQKLGEVLRKQKDSKFLSGVGDWIKRNPNTAAWGTLVPGSAVGGAIWDGSQKGTEKAIGVVDKNAFKYRDSQEQQVQ